MRKRQGKHVSSSFGQEDRASRNLAVATTIPFVLLSGPLVGYGIGYLLDKGFGTSFFFIIFIVLGLLASIKMTIDLIAKIS